MQAKKLSGIRRVLHAIIRIITWIAAASLGVMALFTFTNVLGRYLFQMPVKGTVEIVELTLAVTVFFSMAYTETVNGHITMEEVVGRFPQRIKTIIRSIMYLAAAVFFFVIAYGDTKLSASYLYPVVRESDILHIPIAPFVFVVAIGSFVFALELLLKGMCTGQSEQGNEEQVT